MAENNCVFKSDHTQIRFFKPEKKRHIIMLYQQTNKETNKIKNENKYTNKYGQKQTNHDTK